MAGFTIGAGSVECHYVTHAEFAHHLAQRDRRLCPSGWVLTLKTGHAPPPTLNASPRSPPSLFLILQLRFSSPINPPAKTFRCFKSGDLLPQKTGGTLRLLCPLAPSVRAEQETGSLIHPVGLVSIFPHPAPSRTRRSTLRPTYNLRLRPTLAPSSPRWLRV